MALLCLESLSYQFPQHIKPNGFDFHEILHASYLNLHQQNGPIKI